MSRVLWLPAGQALGGLDARGLFYPWLSFAREAVWHGRMPLWDANHFAGYPFLSNPQVAFFYPPTWLALLLPVRFGLTAINMLHIWLAGMGTYLFLRQQKATPVPAALAGLTFAFSGFTAVRLFAGHLGFLGVHAWLPWLLLATQWAFARPDWKRGVLAGLPFGLAILAGHTTSLIYVGLAWLAYAGFLAATTRRWQLALRQMLFIGVVGLGVSAVQLLPLIQFSLISSRTTSAGLEFATAFSMPPAHLITLLIPDFFGEPVRAGYWSVPNFEELTYYAGLLPLLGLALALRRPDKQVWFWVSLALTGLLLALGSYGFLFEIVYRLLPPFRLARAPARAAVWFTFATAVLLGLALTRWQKPSFDDRRSDLAGLLRWLLGTTAVAGIAALAATGAVFASQHPSDTSGRLWHQLGGWGWALLALLLGGGLLWGYLTAATTTRKRWFGGGLLLLVIADLWLFGYPLLRPESMAPHPLWPDAAAIITAQEEGGSELRVLPWGVSIFDQNGAGAVGLSSVFGYNALEVGNNTALAASVPDPRSTAYDILGAGYVLAYGPLENYEDGPRPLTLLDQTANVWVYTRARTLPLVRLVTQVEVIPDEQAAIARIHEPAFDPAQTAILAQEPPCLLDGDAAGTAVTQDHSAGHWTINTEASGSMLLVLGETAYPGWQVYIDGQPAEPLTAYTAVRAVCVPAGQHTVTWTFRPTIFLVGGLLSLLTLVLAAAAGWRTYRA